MKVFMKSVIYLTVLVTAMLLRAPIIWSKNPLPSEFGDIVPLYESAKVLKIKRTRDAVQVSFGTRTDPARVVAFYRQALPKTGWRLVTGEHKNPSQDLQVKAVKDKIHLTLECQANSNAQLTQFHIHLNYIRGRE